MGDTWQVWKEIFDVYRRILVSADTRTRGLYLEPTSHYPSPHTLPRLQVLALKF